MTTLEMGDSSTPPATTHPLPVYAFYIGGDTPHVWTDTEISAIASRWVLPIWVNTDPGANAEVAAADIINWLHAHHYAAGEAVAIDTEAVEMPVYIGQVNALVTAAGFKVLDYESKSPAAVNPLTSGGRWEADWTGVPHLMPGTVATQYASSDMIGMPWDASLIDAAVKLHELHPVVTRPLVNVTITATLPELVIGDSGAAVKRMQHLILAWAPGELATYGADGQFGPETQGALRSFQRVYGVGGQSGQCDAPTWTRLVEG